MKLLLTGPGFEQRHYEALAASGFETLHERQPSRERLIEVLPTISHYLLGGDEQVDAALLAHASSLRHIAFIGGDAGAFIDLEAATKLHIVVSTTPGATAGAVAEHTIGLLLGLARGLFAQNEAVKRNAPLVPTTRELSDMRVGIVGLGRIGLKVAALLRQGFGATVIYTSANRKSGVEAELGLNWTSLPELFSVCDAVSLHAPATQQTRGMIGAAILANARPGLLLVNTAPAALVDPAALKQALATGQVGAAAFDGYWQEPPPTSADDAYGFLRLPDARFVVTPHTAAKTTRAWPSMVDAALSNMTSSLT
ncbi:D-isomer specific 2-hydroxyacid dehydrogenase family protein [Mesorhizobium sp. M1060]|uniref:D-isomer specific 2-hydroxyacid dehydrogenase family protein n=1 Tax=Mesorhizobium sp. M1060 TaxID=2957052 RepID=UPI003338845B